MNRVDVLLSTDAVTLRRFDHPPDHEHVDPAWETSHSCSISVVEAGSFDVAMEGGRWRFARGSIFLTRPGMEYSCTHDSHLPVDRCLSVAFTDRTVEELSLADVPALRAPFAVLSARQNYLRHRLASCTTGDAIRLELLAGALYESLAVAAPARPIRAAGSVTLLMRRIDRAAQLIESDFARALTLDELARAAGLSSFHFARVFRQLLGLPPHRYLTAVRLRHAVRRLAQGESVTDTCYNVGFGSLSHFINAFRRRFGVSPSEVKRGGSVAPLRAALATPTWHRAAG